MALLKHNCPEAAWVKTTATPGFDGDGYWAIRIRRGSRIASTDNRDTSKRKKRGRWAKRYETKNRARANSLSKWASWQARV